MPCHNFFEGLIIGAAVVVISFISSALLDKIKKHDDKIEELFLRLEECDESSQEVKSASLLDIIRQHDDEIQKLFSRLEKNDESSELKK